MIRRTTTTRARLAVGLVATTMTAAVACQPGAVSGVGPLPHGTDAVDAPLFVQPGSPAHRQMETWRDSRPGDAAYIARIADEAQALWFGDWNRDVRSAVGEVMTASAAVGALPVLVAYNIPDRDCGSYSAGGARDAAAYRGWVRDFAAGLGGRQAIVILEPDAVAAADCLPNRGRTERLELIRHAVVVLKDAGATVYVDAGHAFWKSPEDMAAALRSAGVGAADGFALNVSNYHSTAANIRFGEELSRRLGGARFVVDTSRNGLATARPDEWCNAANQALGERPRLNPGHPLVAAYLWVKRPGESDGSCNGGPAAGEWWPDYALGLAQRQPVALAATPTSHL